MGGEKLVQSPFAVNNTKEAVVSKVNKESIWENSEGWKDVITG